MAEAWIKREAERRDLLQSLMQQAYGEDDRKEDAHFLFRLAKTCLAHLQQRRENRPRRDMKEAEQFFFQLRQQIGEFSRSQVEEDALVAEFTKQLVGETLHSFRAELQREEHEAPERVFRAPSAMAKVPL